MRTTSVFINKLGEQGFPFAGKIKFTLMSEDPDFISRKKPVTAFFINGKAKVQLIPNIFISKNVSTYYHYEIFAQHPVNSPTEVAFEKIEEGDCIVPIKPSCLQEIIIPTQEGYTISSGSNINSITLETYCESEESPLTANLVVQKTDNSAIITDLTPLLNYIGGHIEEVTEDVQDAEFYLGGDSGIMFGNDNQNNIYTSWENLHEGWYHSWTVTLEEEATNIHLGLACRINDIESEYYFLENQTSGSYSRTALEDIIGKTVRLYNVNWRLNSDGPANIPTNYYLNIIKNNNLSYTFTLYFYANPKQVLVLEPSCNPKIDLSSLQHKPCVVTGWYDWSEYEPEYQ